MGAHGTPSEEAASLRPFRDRLAFLGFEGEFASGASARLVAATDNSIYQVLPAAVLYPRTADDLNRIVRAARATDVALSPRGGGTGTNGQSLTSGVMVDVSRHLDRIGALDVEARLVTVEPGVVLDQLNAFLSRHGLFFAPMVSTASRATIGGMVATDASGKGSRIYGKTSAHVASLDVVLSDGSDWTIRPLDRAGLDTARRLGGIVGDVHREVHRIVTEHANLIDATFPDINRGLTGYNLQGVARRDGTFNLAYLLAGSEGTLALTKSVTLRVLPRPRHRALVVARYASFDDALRDVRHLMVAEPAAVEVIDDKVLSVATRDVVWSGMEAVLGGPSAEPVRGLNFVEFVAADADAVGRGYAEVVRLLATSPFKAMDWAVVTDATVIGQLWSLREKAVGLLGKLGGKRQGTSFVEDTAVRPELLADFVTEFRAILDRHALSYGMYGHADVGCLHVRPALDMADPADAGVIRPVSDEVAALAKRYGGLLWGEHGRGYRGEYSPLFFGPVLYAELGNIKRAFDPTNLFNPGKLASPGPRHRVDRIDAVPLRGEADRRIDADHSRAFDGAVACNGNGACHSWDAFTPMCPSYKATRDRVQSPKGRATLLRNWATLASERDRGAAVGRELAALEEEVKASLDTCLSCKACSNLCPVKVDVPTMKARFLADYYMRRRRPLRDRVLSRLEGLLPAARLFPRAANVAASMAGGVARRVLGLVDLPRIRPMGRRRGSAAPRMGRPGVVLLQDGFLGTFDGGVVDAAATLLERLGYDVRVSGIGANGKAQQVLGMLDRFAVTARRAQLERLRLGAFGLPIVSLDAATGLLYDQEYQEFAPLPDEPPVIPIEGFLAAELDAGRLPRAGGAAAGSFTVLLHCTERTARPETADRWRRVFDHFGMVADVPSAGCCGMAGMFGHEVEHADLSRRIFDLGWRPRIDAAPTAGRVLATGFSCRCQTKRFADFHPPHPVEAILAHIEGCQE